MYPYVVEFLGTALFLLVILLTGQAIPIGLALMAVIMLGGKVSGGHFNPAVSVMMWRKGSLKMADLAPYVIAQVLGGLVALELSKHIKL
jgi:aquaporin Z|tara:strand:+ start:211 stop:477 length:267 start_codon:yes stop_codon:yes gene_type:complete